MLRNLQFGDLKALEGYPRDFPLPDLSSGLYCIQKALLNHNQFVGAALLKLTSEAVLILDPKLNSITKASLIQESFVEIKSEAINKYGLDQVHVFVLPESDVKYAEFLQRHFEFQRATGIPLVYSKI